MKTLMIAFSGFVLLSSCSGGAETTGNTTDTTKQTSTETTEQTQTQISEDIDATKFKELIDGGQGIILDVRTPGEYAGGNIAGSINIDFNGGSFEASLDTLDKNKPVYVYCQAGGRSGQAKEMMKEKGFTEVYNLIGGYGGWPYKQ